MFEQTPQQKPQQLPAVQQPSPFELPAFLMQGLQRPAPAKKPRPEKERLFKQMTRRTRPGH